MKVITLDFGKLTDESDVKIFTFEAKNGLIVKITNYGGIITSIETPDKEGKRDEIIAGFPTLEQYLKGHPHFGVIVGRYANRIANGRFMIFGKEYSLPINNGPNHLHGGFYGFHTKLWNYELITTSNRSTLKLFYISPHYEEGYPGNLKVSVSYTITDSNEILITYFAKTDAHTHVNLTSHSYFNLSGFKNKIYDHSLWLDSNYFVAVNEQLIPTGEIKPCAKTHFDFTKTSPLGEKISSIPNGIDHCFVLDQPRDLRKPAALLTHNPSGRSLTIYCTQPGIQVYTGNSLDGSLIGNNQTPYQQHSAICLETQHFPDSPNHCNFPSTLLTPGETYFHETKMVFGLLP